MKNGFRVWDVDTHINPGADVLDKYVDPGFRPRLSELMPYKAAIRSRDGTGDERFIYRFDYMPYERTLGEAEKRPGSRDERQWRGGRRPSAGVEDDRADNRVGDMDIEGADRQFLVPSAWTAVVGHPDVSIEIALIRAFHRHMQVFCGAAPERLKGPIVASTRDVGEAVREIREWGKSKWAVAVMPLLPPNDRPVDHPDLEPIWQAAAEHDLAIVNHSFFANPPYFPGYRDMWDNAFLARLCAHPWGAMRFMAGFLAGGVLDRHPILRLAVLECGFGWLPFWVRRMDEQVAYMGRTAKLKLLPSEQFAAGRVFCNIEAHEQEPMYEMVTKALGDGVLMYASDYPHYECWYPNSIDKIMEWSSIGPPERQKLFWGNASRCFKAT
ncbi:MAG TPA: amidohydrolase family protein [Stellaceae bacterium]|nr:amidohydrolase family protein [Stellaceae bacterium]